MLPEDLTFAPPFLKELYPGFFEQDCTLAAKGIKLSIKTIVKTLLYNDFLMTQLILLL